MAETQHTKKQSHVPPQTKAPQTNNTLEIQAPAPLPGNGFDLHPDNILQFQRTVGNQKTVQLARGIHQPKSGFTSSLLHMPQAAKRGAISRSAVKVPVSHTAAPRIQRNVMPFEVWKDMSSVTFGIRPDEFEWIDKALQEYHSGTSEQNRGFKLSLIEDAIEIWERSDTSPSKKRKQAVDVLKKQIVDTRARLDPSATPDKKAGLFQIWSPSEFEQKTAQERAIIDAGNSVFQDQIIVSLKRFHRLADPMGADAPTALGIIYEMQQYAHGWLDDYAAREKKNREQRKAGFQEFLIHLSEIQTKLEKNVDVSDIPATVNVTNAQGAVTGTRALTEDERREQKIEKIKTEHVGNAESLFAKIGGFLGEKLASQNGSSTEIEIEVQIPVDPSGTGFIGGKLVIKAERDGGMTKLRGESSLVGGGKIAKLVEIKAELGGYMEAQASTPEMAAKLMSYAMYRRLQQSRTIPREIHEYIWGGRTGSTGHKLAEQWAANVEKEVFGGSSGDDAFVESGGFAGVSGKVGGEELGAEASYRYSRGSRITKRSVNETKGVGKTMARPTARGGIVDDVSEDTSLHQVTIKANAGVISGEFEVKYGGLMQQRELEIGFKAAASLPGSGNLAGLIISDLRAVLMKLVEFLRTKKGLTGKTADETNFLGAGDALYAISSGKNWEKYIRQGATDPTGPLKSNGSIEVAIGYLHQFASSKNEFKVSFNSVSETKLDLEVVKGGFKQSKRIFGFQYKDGGWGFI